MFPVRGLAENSQFTAAKEFLRLAVCLILFITQGLLDMIIHRKNLKSGIAQVIDYLT